MSPSRTHKPHRGRIPGTMVLDWHSSNGSRAVKPVVRRPKTACAPCRTAKVRCKGKQECERCKGRGLRCEYTTTETRVIAPATLDRDLASLTNGLSPTTDDATHGAMTGSVPTDSSIYAGFDDSLSFVGGMDFMNSSEDTFTRALEELNWEFPDNNGLDIFGSRQPTLSEPDPFSTLTSLTKTSTDFAALDNETTAAATDTDNDTYTPNNLPHTHTHPIQPDSKRQCQCRLLLISQIPKLETMMQETAKTWLEHVLKATEDVITSCQVAVNCTVCQIRPVDLVCVASVFQQTAGCFGHITRSMIDSTVRVSIRGYEISVADDATCRRMLVSNLVKQASTLLESLSRLAQDQLLPSQQQNNLQPRRINRSPACLKHVNLEYVREVVANFRKFFRLITVFDEKQPSERLLSNKG